MGLFGPDWKSKNEKKAMACVQKEQDEFELINIAHFAPLPQVRHYAASKINNICNMILLYWQPKTDDSINSVMEERLHNHPKLVSVVLESHDEFFRDVALLMMDDEDMLIEVISRTRDQEILEEAFRKLHSHNAMMKAAKCRAEAAAILSDEDDIFRLLMEIRDHKIADILLPKINDGEKYLFLAWKADDTYVSSGASAYITDEKELRRLVIDRKLYGLLERISDEKNLQWIEEHTDNAYLLKLIYERQGVYVCSSCGRKSTAASCFCKLCGGENHLYVHKSNVREYRDYAVGHTWEECSRCGRKINVESVYDGYLE